MRKLCKSRRSLVAILFFVQVSLNHAQAIARHENPAQYLSTGDNYAQGGQYAKAIASYSKVIKLDKSNPVGYQRRAGVELQQQKYKDAIRDLSKALALNRHDAESLSAR